MNIYLVKRTTEVGYDEYDSVVVIARSAVEAKRMVPDKEAQKYWNHLLVKRIGTAEGRKKPSFVLKSFNAG